MADRRLLRSLPLTLVLAFAWIGCFDSKSARDEPTPVSELIQLSSEGVAEPRPTLLDPERRIEKWDRAATGDGLDRSAIEGMPADYGNLLVDYVQDCIRSLKGSPLNRKRFYHSASGLPSDPKGGSTSPFPDGANPILDQDVPVPFLVLPRPAAVKAWSESPGAERSGWRSEQSVVKSRGKVYGRTLIYSPGAISEHPRSLPAAPIGSRIPSFDVYFEHADYFLKLGKLITSPFFDFDGKWFPVEVSTPLHLGEKNGAQLLGEFVTVPAYAGNSRLMWASITSESKTRRFLAYTLVDGNGAKRVKGFGFQDLGSGPVSPYVRPLTCALHQPRIKQHDELLLPVPQRWPSTFEDWEPEDNVYEKWCLDDWFAAQTDACWVLREAEDSKPLRESFILMPAAEDSDRPLFLVAIFGETEPGLLLKQLATLYGTTADAALGSPETMQRLTSLFEKIRNYSFVR